MLKIRNYYLVALLLKIEIDLKWVMLYNAFSQIDWEELCNVVSAVSECHLCEVIGTERKELRLHSNLQEKRKEISPHFIIYVTKCGIKEIIRICI